MRRVLMILAVLGILGLAAGQAQAHGYYYHPAYHHGYYGYYAPVVVRPAVVVPVAPPGYYSAYPPVYGYRYYAPCPRYGVYYQGRGLSIGIGF
jgi:hypothetical protein